MITTQTEIFISCDCGSEILKVEYWEEDSSYCFITFRHSPLKYSLWRRLKFLLRGIVEYNEIILGESQINELRTFINPAK